jgi:dTDP-4-amino-4,6-dideoxygalactose transaminase
MSHGLETMKFRFLDLKVVGDERLDLLRAIESVMDSGMLVMGPSVEEFEVKIANLCQRKFAIGVGSGTDALFTGLRALDLSSEDEIITTSMSWIATANAIVMAGARPVFADVNEDFNICIESVSRLINEKTRAVLTVNFNGLMSNTTELAKLCEQKGILLIEDAAQSFGAILNGKPSGSFGYFTAMSHNPMKILGGLGECGSILSDDEDFKSKLEVLRYNGTVNRQTCIVPSLNSRIDSIQASILLSRIKYAYKEIEIRRSHAEIYENLIGNYVKTPTSNNSNAHVYYAYTIRTPFRDKLKLFLDKVGVETKIMHPLPMPCHPAYEGSVGEWQNAIRLSSEILSLPIASHLGESQIHEISNLIISFFEKNS